MSSKMQAKQHEALETARLPSVSEATSRRAQRHGAIEAVVPEEVFAVQGSFPLQLGAPTKLGLTKIVRTMTIVREGNELTLINGIHLTPKGYAQLDALGKVKRVVRLGAFHGGDDAHLLKRYRAEYWVLEGLDVHEGLDALGVSVKTMRPGSADMPVAGATVLHVPETKLPEGLLILPQADGVLVSVDSLMNNPDKICVCGGHTSLMMQFPMKKLGLVGEGRAAGPWLELNYTAWDKSPEQILPTFYREELFPARWDTLITAHGPPIPSGAKAKVRHTLQEQFSVTL